MLYLHLGHSTAAPSNAIVMQNPARSPMAGMAALQPTLLLMDLVLSVAIDYYYYPSRRCQTVLDKSNLCDGLRFSAEGRLTLQA